MRNHSLESRVRENRTHGSEGGEGERPFLPYQSAVAFRRWMPATFYFIWTSSNSTASRPVWRRPAH